VPVHVVDIDGIARGELAENACRKDFTPSEMVAIADLGPAECLAGFQAPLAGDESTVRRDDNWVQ
jgi:hypothetical protein